MKEYAQLGAKIYTADNNKFSSYRRMVVFIIRSMVNSGKMQDLKQFCQMNSLRQDITAAHPFVFEQVTRSVFYRHSTFVERLNLIKEHLSFLEIKFTQEALRRIYLGEGIVLWSDNYREEALSLELLFHDNQIREGLMGIALKLGKRRIYQIVFWVALNKSGEMVLKIGALQGSLGGIDILRDLTKHFYGYRPKNLILHALRTVTGQLALGRIYAVSNHGFYANNHIRLDRKLKTSLDEFWQEAGGKSCSDPRFFELPITEPRKSLDEVESKKRNLYRKRFAAIDAIDATIKRSLELYIKK